MLNPLSLDLAQDVIRERQQSATRSRLARQARNAQRAASRRAALDDLDRLTAAAVAREAPTWIGVLAPRQRLASGLRALATWLDPCVSGDPPFVIVKAR